MMKTVLSCILLLVVCTQATSTFFPETTSPVLLWSGQNVFSGKSIQHLERTTSKQLGMFISQLESRSVTTLKLTTAEAKPEVIVLFVTENSGIHSSQLSQFEKLVTSAESSVIIPYNYHDGQRTTSENMLSALSGKLIISKAVVNSKSSDENTKYVATSALSSFLGSEEEKSFVDKTHSEVVIVYLKGVEDAQHFVESTTEQISKITNGNFIAILFADEKIQAIEETKEAVHFQMAVIKRETVDNNDYFPVSVWEGIMASVVLIFILAVGVGCLSTVQTPKRWGTGKYVVTFTEINDP
eukprot:TRINITY_DN11607_c0_g1_i1.p1 TRINITY_DN11607_c0_g1~~TRINITY_DN11607_c0_g1_i1.p1  ORF type:complete len:298 (+),score=64.86 TRINITY_DN11607_c0_g1_i1:54-947(+)